MPTTLTIQPWPDPVIDTLGYDPRSRYVETFWLPTLGPTALLLLRHLADRFDRHPEGIELTVSDTSHALGLGQRDGSSSPVVRTLQPPRAVRPRLRRRCRHRGRAPQHPTREPAPHEAAPLGAPARPRRVGRGAARRRAARDRAPQRPACGVHAARTGRRRRPRRARAARHRASTPRSATRARGGRTNATAKRSTTRRGRLRAHAAPPDPRARARGRSRRPPADRPAARPVPGARRLALRVSSVSCAESSRTFR